MDQTGQIKARIMSFITIHMLNQSLELMVESEITLLFWV